MSNRFCVLRCVYIHKRGKIGVIHICHIHIVIDTYRYIYIHICIYTYTYLCVYINVSIERELEGMHHVFKMHVMIS